MPILEPGESWTKLELRRYEALKIQIKQLEQYAIMFPTIYNGEFLKKDEYKFLYNEERLEISIKIDNCTCGLIDVTEPMSKNRKDLREMFKVFRQELKWI